MFTPINTFGFKLLHRLLQPDDSLERLLAPPVVFGGLALLKSAAAGATRSGLARALSTDESLTAEQRDRKMRTVHETLAQGGVFCIENLLHANSYQPLSPSFVLLAKTVFGVTVMHEEAKASLALRGEVQAQLTLSATEKNTQVYQKHILAQRFATTSPRHAFYLFQPSRLPFWVGRKKQGERLLAAVGAQSWEAWRAAFQEELPEHSGTFPQVSFAESVELVPVLKELEVGPALTTAADFSRMMLSGTAAPLSRLQHQVQLKLERPEGEPAGPLPQAPFIWVLCDEPTGLITLLGGQL